MFDTVPLTYNFTFIIFNFLLINYKSKFNHSNHCFENRILRTWIFKLRKTRVFFSSACALTVAVLYNVVRKQQFVVYLLSPWCCRLLSPFTYIRICMEVVRTQLCRLLMQCQWLNTCLINEKNCFKIAPVLFLSYFI